MFNNQKGATVGYQEIEGKDEYKAMLKLLEKSNIKDAIITADAAFTHQEITEKIVARGADFAISLKGNEANLLYQTENLFNEAEEKKSLTPTNSLTEVATVAGEPKTVLSWLTILLKILSLTTLSNSEPAKSVK